MRQFVMTMTVGLCAASSAWAGPHEKAAKQLLEAMNSEQTMAATLDATLTSQLQANPAMAPFEDVMREFMAKHMAYSTLESELIPLYVEAFTIKELKGLIKFYDSPLGQRAVEELPALTTAAANIGMTRVQQNMGELQAAIQARMAELEAEAQADAEPSESTDK